MRKHLLMLVVGLFAFGGLASAASADSVQQNVGGTWSNLPSNSSISGTTTSGDGVRAVLTTSLGNVEADSTVTGTIGTNPATDDVSGSISALSWTNLDSNLSFGTVTSISTQSLPYGAAVDGDAGTLSIYDPRVRVNISTFLGTVACYYGVEDDYIVGDVNNANSTVEFNDTVEKLSGSSFLCSDDGTWEATYELSSGGNALRVQP